ncbi:C-type lectin mosGCTL-1-like [Saccoglossus kowalevskii]
MMAVVNDVEVHRKIRKHINSQTDTLRECMGNGYWIGATDSVNEGQFVFTNGEQLPTDYEKWYSGQPGNSVKRDVAGQDCVQLWQYKAPKYTWNLDDDYCWRRKSYVCQYSGPGICVLDNPCQHTCESSDGITANCGCDEGFVLSEDGITCDSCSQVCGTADPCQCLMNWYEIQTHGQSS